MRHKEGTVMAQRQGRAALRHKEGAVLLEAQRQGSAALRHKEGAVLLRGAKKGQCCYEAQRQGSAAMRRKNKAVLLWGTQKGQCCFKAQRRGSAAMRHKEVAQIRGNPASRSLTQSQRQQAPQNTMSTIEALIGLKQKLRSWTTHVGLFAGRQPARLEPRRQAEP
eukprot:1153080-Pelagomonas_calceolata.AAC.5